MAATVFSLVFIALFHITRMYSTIMMILLQLNFKIVQKMNDTRAFTQDLV